MAQIERPAAPYLQVAAQLREQIVSGAIRPGQILPSTRQLTTDFGISKATATRALAVLASEGLTEGRVGSGTMVKGNAPIYRRARDRYAQLKATGSFYGPGEGSVITAAELVEAPEEVRDFLGLPEGASAIRRHRITSRNGERVEVSTSWFDGALAEVAPLLLSTERIPNGTANYVEQVTGRKVVRGCKRTSVRLATDEEAAELNRPTPLAVYVTQHTAADEQGQTLTYEVGLTPPGYSVTYDYEI